MKRTLLSLTILATLVAPLRAADKRAFTIEDLYRVKNVSSVSLSPDGKSIVYAVTTSDFPKAKRRTQIWMMDRDGKNARQLTQGDNSSSGPFFSPDGRSIYFSSSRGGTQNLYRLPLSGGEATQVTKISTGVSDPVISSDGKRIVFASDVYPECGADDACNKKIADRWADGPLKAHMADTLLARHWTSWKDGTRTHILSFDVDSGKVSDLTPGDFDAPPFSLGGPLQYDLSPDGKELAFASNHEKEQASSTNSDLWLLTLDGKSQARNITAANKAFDNSPKYSPDGKTIGYRLQTQPGYESDWFRLALYDRTTGKSRIVSEAFKDWVDDFFWSDDSKTIYFTGSQLGDTPIYKLDLASGAITKLYSDRTIDEFIVTDNGRSLLYVQRSVGAPQEIYSADIQNNRRTALTTLNKTFMDEVDVRPAEPMWVDSPNGRIHVYIVKPHNFDASKKYPLILNVHGGPQQMWGDAFRGDWQVYPGAGYVVAFANPTGSTGYGQPFTAAISGDWGGKPFEDLMKVTDALEKLPYVDKNRMGAMGWSYGGYMMNWFLGHTDRFKAIASMMGLYNLTSFYGATEELWFPEWDAKGQPWNSELYQTMSPSSFVKNFKTPTLIITGERDYRVPYTESLQLFTALQKMNVPSRLIVYSEAGHWPSWYEMGLYYTAHLEWFQKYLGGGGAPWTTEAFLRNAVFDPSTGERIPEEKRDEARTQENKQDATKEKPKV